MGVKASIMAAEAPEAEVAVPREAPAKGWCFTLNNPPDGTRERLLGLVDDEDYNVEYVVFQLERGEGGTPHYQGYLHLREKRRFNFVRALVPGGHIEKRKGSPAQAIAYCQKEDTRVDGPWEAGRCPAPGKALELGEVQRKLDEGATMAEVSRAHFGVFLHYSRGLKEYVQLHRPQRDWQTTVVVLWGESGTGKSRRAKELAGPGAYWLPRPAGNSVWFDGYDGHKTVVIDEFYGWASRDFMLRLIDRYPMFVEVKGGNVPMLAETVYITCNVPPEQWWPRVGLGAMERRLRAPIGVVYHVTAPLYDEEGRYRGANLDMEGGFRDRRPPPLFIPPRVRGEPIAPVDYNIAVPPAPVGSPDLLAPEEDLRMMTPDAVEYIGGWWDQ